MLRLKHSTGQRTAQLIMTILMGFMITSSTISAQEQDPGQPPDRTGRMARSTIGTPSVTATGGVGQISLRWGSINGAARYEVVAKKEFTDQWLWLNSNVTSTSYTHSGLDHGRNYFYWVRAYDSGGGSGNWGRATAYSSGSNVPSRLTLTLTGNPSARSVTVDWNDETSTHYELHYYLNNRWTRIGGNLTTSAFTHSGLNYNTTYKYTVRAVNSSGNGPWSSHRSISLTEPAPVTDATHTPTTIVQNATHTPTTIHQNATHTPTTIVQNATATNTPVTAATPVPTSTPTATPIPVPGKPSVRTSLNNSDRSIRLTWNNPNPPAVKYEIAYWQGSEWTYPVGNDYRSLNWTHLYVSRGTQYQYHVRGFNSAGQAGPWSSSANVQVPAATATPSVLPAPSLSVGATHNTIGSIGTSWTSIFSAVRYELQGRRHGHQWQTINQSRPYHTSFTHSGLEYGLTYYYRVRAIDNRGNAGRWSQTQWARTIAPTATPTHTPTLTYPELTATASAVSARETAWAQYLEQIAQDEAEGYIPKSAPTSTPTPTTAPHP